MLSCLLAVGSLLTDRHEWLDLLILSVSKKANKHIFPKWWKYFFGSSLHSGNNAQIPCNMLVTRLYFGGWNRKGCSLLWSAWCLLLFGGVGTLILGVTGPRGSVQGKKSPAAVHWSCSLTSAGGPVCTQAAFSSVLCCVGSVLKQIRFKIKRWGFWLSLCSHPNTAWGQLPKDLNTQMRQPQVFILFSIAVILYFTD